jgi:hypothetical protein
MVLPVKAEIYYQQDFEAYSVGSPASVTGEFFTSPYPWDVDSMWKIATDATGNKFLNYPISANSPIFTNQTFPDRVSVEYDFRTNGNRLTSGIYFQESALQVYAWFDQYGAYGVYYYETAQLGSNFYITPNKWYHVKHEFDRGLFRVYMDGVFIFEYDFGQTLEDFNIMWTSGTTDIDNILVQDLPPIPVTINAPNIILVRSHGNVPVTIFSTLDFDAGVVDQNSLTFGATGDEQSLAFCNDGKDVNGDGLSDLVCHFYAGFTGFNRRDTVAILKGQTIDGTPIGGSDSVKIRLLDPFDRFLHGYNCK